MNKRASEWCDVVSTRFTSRAKCYISRWVTSVQVPYPLHFLPAVRLLLIFALVLPSKLIVLYLEPIVFVFIFFYSQYDSTMSRTPTKAELRNIDQLVGQIRSRQWALSPLPPDKLSKTERRMLDNDRKTLHIMINYLSNVVSQFDVIPPSAAHVLR